MAPAAGAKNPANEMPYHIRLFNDVKNRLEIEKQVTFEESGKAFVQAQERVAEPEARKFINDVMTGAVEIFLNQNASSVQPTLLVHFEEVLRSSGKIISWEVRNLGSIRHLELLSKILDDSATFYQDKKVLIGGQRRCGMVRLTIARELLQDGTFTLLFQMLKGQTPIKEWSPLDFAVPAGKPIPTQAPLTARIINLLLIVAFNARLAEIDMTAFGVAAMKEVTESFKGDTLKRQKAEDVMELHAILMQVFGAQDPTFHEFSLNLWLRCFETDAFAIKKLGLDNLIKVCGEASRYRQPQNRPGLSPSPSVLAAHEVGATPGLTWDDAKVCAWLVEKRVLDNLFGSGSQTHSALVGRSKNLLEYMAIAGTLGAPQIDMIFESCVGQHESSRGAVHSLLAELLLDLAASPSSIGHDSPSIAILRRASALCSKRPEEMYFFGKKLMQLESSARNRGIMTSRNYDLQRALLDFLWTLSLRSDLSSGDERESENRADQVLADFNDALRTAVVPLPLNYATHKAGERMNEDKIFTEFLSRCEAMIHPSASLDEASLLVEYADSTVFRACRVLKHLVQLHPDVIQPQDQVWLNVDKVRPDWTKQSQSAFVETLDQRLHLLDWLVERITAMPSSLPDAKVKWRLDFLKFLSERIRSYECLDFSKIKLCWNALTNFPDMKLIWFQDLVSGNGPRVLASPVTRRVFEEIICPSPIALLGSDKGFDCFAAYFDDVNRDIFVVQTSMDLNPIPIEARVSGLETLWSLAIQGSGRVADKASQMLLSVQRKLEGANRESGKAFVERMLSALQNASSEELKNRCVRLTAAYFGSQVILNSHSLPLGASSDPSFTQELTIHHDDILTFSVDDVGKVMEKRFREKNGYGWYAGCIYDFNPSSCEHSVFFKDGDVKHYDMRLLTREGSRALLESPNPAERQQFRMLSVVSDGPLRVDAKISPNSRTAEALKRYRGIRVSVAGTTTLAQLKSHVIDRLGRKAFEMANNKESDLEFQVELDGHLANVPTYLSLRTNVPAAAGGKQINYVRYRVVNEALPATLIAPRFGGRLFLCAVTTDASASLAEQGLNTVESSADDHNVSAAYFLTRESSPQFALLMNLIQDPGVSQTTRRETWDLLMALPTEAGLLRRAVSSDFDWSDELIARDKKTTVLLQVYLLQVADRLYSESVLDECQGLKTEKSEAFSRNFFQKSIADELLKVFSRVMSEAFTNEWERGVALRVTVRLIRRAVEHRLISNSVQLSKDLTRLMLWDTKNSLAPVSVAVAPVSPRSGGVVNHSQAANGLAIVHTQTFAASSVPNSTSATPGLDEAGESSATSPGPEASQTGDLSLLAVSMETELVEDPANHLALLFGDEASGRSLTDVLLESAQLGVREAIYRLLLRIAETNRDAVFSAVLRTLTAMPHYTLTCQNFFDFVNEFTVVGTPEQKDESGLRLMSIVRQRLSDYAYSGNGEDPTLTGFFELCRRLVESGSGSESDDKALVEVLLSKYLLATETAIIATSPATRLRCFTLLRALTVKNASTYIFMVEKINEFICMVEKPQARGGRTWDFNFRADDTRRNPGTYVGLVNQGATCYQNSVLQQLFMRKEMRKLIVSAIPNLPTTVGGLQDKGEDDDSTVDLTSGGEPAAKRKVKSKRGLLTQLQKLFRFLEGSEQKWHNPRLFVNQSAVLRLTDGHMSQNDCIEFYSLLMEYLEDAFKTRPEREMLRNLFVCSMSSLTIRHCPAKHRSEKEESTFYISLSIRYGPEGRALNSLEEALDEWSKSEHLSDLICEECFPPKAELNRQASGGVGSSSSSGGVKKDEVVKQRFEADQVKFITRFPPILVLQLKRFDFDYDTLLPTKLNHRVSFEQRLDLGRFTREAVLRQFEGGSESAEEPHVWYRLKGVVVHQGTGANFGHYYSFIEDDEKKAWFRFDDERVTPFDLANLEDECFGGPVTSSLGSGDGKTPAYAAAAAAASNKRIGLGGLRNNNGYLLIYVKDTPNSASLSESVKVSAAEVSKAIPPLQVLSRRPMSTRVALRVVSRIVNLCISWRARARTYVEAKAMLKEHEIHVAKENQRALRHGIAFAPDFIHFCLRAIAMACPNLASTTDHLSQTNRVEVGKFAVNALMKVVLFSFSEKDRYEQWLNALRNVLHGSEQAERTVSEYVLERIIATSPDENWLERLLVQCLDGRSSALFTEVLVHAIRHSKATLIKQIADLMVKVFPRNALEAARYTPSDGNFFVVLRELACQSEARQVLLAKDVTLLLVRLVDETAQTPGAETEERMTPHARGSDVGGYTTVARDEKLCGKVVAALDALVIGGGLDDEVGSQGVSTGDAIEELVESGFPQMPPTSSRALFAETLLMILVKYSPRHGKRLIARLCDCSQIRYEKCFQILVETLMTSQYPAKAMDAPIIIPGACDVLFELFMATELDPNSTRMREQTLMQLLKLVKVDAAKRKEEARAMRATTYYSSNSTYADERIESQRAASFLITYVAELVSALAIHSDTCRNLLRNQKWGWLVQYADAGSFEPCVGGNDQCFTRNLERGRAVRTLLRGAIALGQSHPRPFLAPCRTLSYHVEEAGAVEVNGRYRFDGYFPPGVSDTVDTVTPKFARVDPITGKRFTLFRCSATESQLWYISELSDKPGTTSDVDYYQAKDTNTGLPPEGRWAPCAPELKPGPKPLILERDIPYPDDDLLEFYQF